MTEKKITKREMFNRIIATVTDEEIKAFCQREIELLDNKKARSGQSKTQKENENIKAKIVEILTNAENPMTVGQIMVALGNEFSNQKVTSLLTQLKAETKVERIVEKRVAYFTLVD